MKGEEIKILRKQLGLSQEALARLVGVSCKSVCRWEKGNKPSQLAVRRLEEIKKECLK